MDRFLLTKWYLDAVDADGRSAFVYSSALTWGRARVGWHAVSICGPEGEPSHRASISPIALPARDGARLVWWADPLGCAVECSPTHGAVSERLLDGPDGALDWKCEAPAAHVDVTLADAPAIRGVGYAECLSLTLPPWRLPIEELRWGRWVSDDAGRSLVWIDWRGPRARTDAYLDGGRAASPFVSDDVVQATGLSLRLGVRRQLYSRSLTATLAGLGRLLDMSPASGRDVEDAKWLCRARLESADGTAADGWCVDERVRFPR